MGEYFFSLPNRLYLTRKNPKVVFDFWKRGSTPEYHIEQVFNLLLRGLVGLLVHFHLNLRRVHDFCDELGQFSPQFSHRPCHKVVRIVAELNDVLGVIRVAAICLVLKLQLTPLGMGGGKITITYAHFAFPPV